MIRHQCVSENAYPEILHRFCKIILKRAIVIVVLEHSEASVCAVEYVVAVAADVDARSAGHM